DAALATGAHDGWTDSFAQGVLALLGPHARQALGAGQAGRSHHASGARQPRRRAVTRGRGRTVLGDPRPGHEGGRGAHGGAVPPGREPGRVAGMTAMTPAVFSRSGGTMLIRGGRVLDPSSALDTTQDVLVVDGVIRDTGVALAAPEGASVIDAAGKVVCP